MITYLTELHAAQLSLHKHMTDLYMSLVHSPVRASFVAHKYNYLRCVVVTVKETLVARLWKVIILVLVPLAFLTR